MDIRISGHQVDTGEALQKHVSSRLESIAEKFFSRTISAQVTFGLAPHSGFRCDIVCHVTAGLILKGAGEAQEAHHCFDQAAERIEKQLRRYKRRLKDRHVQSLAAEAERTHELNGVAVLDGASYRVFASTPEEEEPAEAPVVVAETRVDIPEATVSDAVMMLDLRNTNALLFINAGTSSYNMVYRRQDGSIGWVEPR
ncbi:MAG TPA: ribosome-associated translation inhibitor RaiA [Sphingobium sp.]|nr:ribosome-associated translation inhibitor RaiA [Sphingobium sp.]